ncbi:uncharacterized protein LOC120388121 isoform X1 [Mauremys reevesii]|uniref:uncharacterized protein LOC120388121 isoform X1 n=1 Tax=Mauremys reevesii TaxID=260615 RepID=UPI00193ECE08|nr:uncharacterized protein LOC120388121 isoform X1 [Mauremys reevesii]XP_039365661.1 uncharacterized protein LOC120388121 isoform X1 [Mauremys reevesii]XP_039365662.1 uncharacterized protein LOC120388121 isoform X1 [Mauremys reevesii]
MPSSMAAVCSLSKLKPLLALELESRLLQAVLHWIYTMGTGQDTTHFRALHNRYSWSLDTILRGWLTETPTLDKLQHLLEHIHRSLLSNNTQERARAVQTSAALLQFATSLPGFDATLCCSWVSMYLTQSTTSAGKPGVGSIGCTGSCCRRGGSTSERQESCGAGTGSRTPSAWATEEWPGWESRRTLQRRSWPSYLTSGACSSCPKHCRGCAPWDSLEGPPLRVTRSSHSLLQVPRLFLGRRNVGLYYASL